MTSYTSPPELLELLEFSISLSIPEKRRILEYMESPSTERDTALVNILEDERQELACVAKYSKSDHAIIAKLRARAAAEWFEINKTK